MSRFLRGIGVTLALVAALGLAAYLVLSIFGSRELSTAQNEYEKVFGKPDLASLAPLEPPADDNAATWLTAGANAVVAPSQHTLITRLARMPFAEWSTSDRKTATELIASNEPALDLVERASQCSGSSFGVDYEKGAYAKLPDFHALLRAHRLISMRARTRLADADRAAFRGDLALMSRFADSLAQESLMVLSMVVLTLDLDYLDVLHEALAAGIDDSLWLEEVESALARMKRRDMVWRALRAEGAVAGSFATAEIQRAMPEQLGGVVGLGNLPWIFDRPAARLLQSNYLRAPTEAADWIDRPCGHWFENPKPEPRALSWAGSPGSHPHFMTLVCRLQAAETARLLALESVRLGRARTEDVSYPSGSRLPAADPFAAAPCRRSTGEDGAPVLECPAARELFESTVGKDRVESANIFSWHLPS